MTVFLVCYLPQVGDEQPEVVFSTKEKAEAYIAAQTYPGHYSISEMVVDEVAA
jgi:hypothetical protein